MIDASRVVFATSLNAFKNDSVQRDTLSLPASLANNAEYTDTVTFTLSEPASFIQVYVYATNYDDYFRYLDSQYHDTWLQLSGARTFLVFDSPITALFNYDINIGVNGDTVTATLYMKNTSGSTKTYTPDMVVPITFVNYTLAN